MSDVDDDGREPKDPSWQQEDKDRHENRLRIEELVLWHRASCRADGDTSLEIGKRKISCALILRGCPSIKFEIVTTTRDKSCEEVPPSRQH